MCPASPYRACRVRVAALPRRGIRARLGGHHGRRDRGRGTVHDVRRVRRCDRHASHRGSPRVPRHPSRHHRDEQLMNRHVVFGTGQVGHPLVTQLVAGGYDVVAVNRDGRGDFPGAEVVGGDATDPMFTTATCEAADVVYFCLNATNYERWSEEFPPLQRGVLAGAASAGARLVVLDNLYAYGPPRGRRLVETMAANPTSAKSATRAAMTAELLAAHGAGQVEVVIGRASDYFGPGALKSALGETVFGTARAGKSAQVMGDPDQPHSYSYTPDVAAGLIALATATGVTGQVWHLPVAETRTTREVVEAVYELAGHKPKILAAG